MLHLRELSLFTGVGGGLLGTLLLGFKPIGYVEWNEYCQRVIAQRIADGILPVAPIFGDVREFVQSGAAREYRGFADVVTGGFPCQPFSVAGKRLGADDKRNMWPATIATIRAVRPRCCFLENVPGLIATGYFGTVIGDLTESGYSVRWRCLSAAELGAPHRRDRLWIVAHANDQRHQRPRTGQSYYDQERNDSPQEQSRGSVIHAADAGGEILGNTTGERLSRREYEALGGRAQRTTQLQPQRPTWWLTEPDVGRLADGVGSRVDRIRAAGNGQVPAVVAAAWHLLTEGIAHG